jgi:hypothetical protein
LTTKEVRRKLEKKRRTECSRASEGESGASTPASEKECESATRIEAREVKETHLHFNPSTCGLVDHSSTYCFSPLDVCW